MDQRTQRRSVFLFFLLSLISYLKYLKQRQKKFLFLGVGIGFLSILAKPTALSLPLILLLCDWYHGRKLDGKAMMEKLMVFVFLIPIAKITYDLHSYKYPMIWWQEFLKMIRERALADFNVYKFVSKICRRILFNENAKNSLRSWRRDELAWREVMQRMHGRKRDKEEKRILSS